MKFTAQQKEDIYIKYMETVDKISDDLEDKTSFSPREIINILLHILETGSYDER